MSRKPDKTASKSAAPAAVKRAAPEPARKAKPKDATSKNAASKDTAIKNPQSATALEKTIGYRFKDTDLRDRALTHISALKGQSRAGSYQRLEFLGDHVLGLTISEMLFAAFPKADEGELSRRLADLVRRESCADVARAIDLGPALKLGASEMRAGGQAKAAILADVFLDGGYPAAKTFVEKFWAERMRKPARPLRDPKTVLQEWAQGRGLPTPVYQEVERTGPHHDPVFRVAVLLPGRDPAEGKGRSKRIAEQAAAAAMLEREGVQSDG
jgi:ribonuclease-3